MAKITPGPWKLYSHSLAPWEQHRIENDHGNHVCELVECDQPDARLIAASPELYDDRRAALDDQRELLRRYEQDYGYLAAYPEIDALRARIAQGEAILAKVDGGN